MRYIVLVLAILSAACYCAAIYFYYAGNEVYQEKLSGAATFILFFFLMPAFLWYRYAKKWKEKENEE